MTYIIGLLDFNKFILSPFVSIGVRVIFACELSEDEKDEVTEARMSAQRNMSSLFLQGLHLVSLQGLGKDFFGKPRGLG